MPEFKDKKHVFTRSKEEFKGKSSGKAGTGTVSGTHLVDVRNTAKQMPKKAIMPKPVQKRQKKG